MKKFISLSIIFISLLSCSKKADNSVKQSQMDSTHKTFLALGDSYTIGESVGASERFSIQTAQLLKDSNIIITTPDIIAVTGWTTRNLLNALDNNPTAKNYSIVTLLIGVNNQYQRRSLEEYKSEFTELLNRAISYAGNNSNHVFVISIPDYSVTPFAQGSDTAAIAREIDDFNAANKAITIKAGIHYVDITPISREAKNDPSLIAYDGLHPSGGQYKRWSELLAPAILQALTQ